MVVLGHGAVESLVFFLDFLGRDGFVTDTATAGAAAGEEAGAIGVILDGSWKSC